MASYQCRGKQKLWSVRFPIIENGKEVQKRISTDEFGNKFQRKKDAESAYRNFMVQYEANQKRNLETRLDIYDRTFKSVYDEYREYKVDRVKDSSLYELEKICEKHILPYFGELTIREITKIEVLKWQQSLTMYSYKYKTKIRGVIYSIFRYLNIYYNVENVVAKVEAFVKPNTVKEMVIWSYEEFLKFTKSFDEQDYQYKVFFTFLYLTGCRLGEALAIGYKDIDFNVQQLNINKSISRKGHHKDGKTYSVTPPKNGTSIRKILIPEALSSCLKTYFEINPYLKKQEFIFGGEKPFNDKKVYRLLNKYLNKTSLKKLRVHDFRHSHASLLIEHGASIVLVSKRLGHKDTRETLNTYAHLFPSSEDKVIQLINKINILVA